MMAHYCLAHGSVLSGRRPDQVDQHHCEVMPKQGQLYKGKPWQMHQGLPQGCCRFSKCMQPADLLALYGKETSSCSVKYSFSATLRVATSVEQWKYPWRKRRVNKSSLRSPRRINSSLQTWTRWCLLTLSSRPLSSSSVKQPTRRLAFLRRSWRT